MAQGKKLTEEEVDGIVKAYVAKVPTDKILRDFEIGISTLTRTINAAKVKHRGQLVDRPEMPMEERIALSVKLQKEGLTHAQIGTRIGVTGSSVGNYLIKAKNVGVVLPRNKKKRKKLKAAEKKRILKAYVELVPKSEILSTFDISASTLGNLVRNTKTPKRGRSATPRTVRDKNRKPVITSARLVRIAQVVELAESGCSPIRISIEKFISLSTVYEDLAIARALKGEPDGHA